MIEVPILHRYLDGTTAVRAGVVVSDAAGLRMRAVKEAGLTLTVTQKGPPPKLKLEASREEVAAYDPTPRIEVALECEDMSKNGKLVAYASITAKDRDPLPGNKHHPEGTVRAVEKILLEFSPADFLAWLKPKK